jgi:hypothetical protein
MKARLPQQRGYMVRDGADAPPHHEDTNPYQRQHQPISSILILRSIAQRCVSKDESPAAATAGATWFETALTRLLTMRINGYPFGRLS